VLFRSVNSISTIIAAAAESPICPNFGEPGWAPFCFLNGNPVFQAFDTYQAFIQNSIVSLHDEFISLGVKNAYGPSIILFTFFVRALLFPITFEQLKSTQKTQALTPKIKEIKEKYPDPNVQNQLVGLLYSETKVNPLAGCLPAIIQIPVFLSLYRSFQNLASENKLKEAFLWLPDLEGPVYGERSTDWVFKWVDGAPSLGWHDTLAFLSVPLILILAQALSLKVLTVPSDDPTVQRTQRLLNYLPIMLGYFSLSVPAGLGVYWITNNLLSTGITASIKAYFKRNPLAFDINLDKLANSQMSQYMNPAWGYKSQEQIYEEARMDVRPVRTRRIPADFV